MLTTLRKFFTSWSPKHRNKVKQHFRPSLEALEERWCPAVQNIWQPGMQNSLWSNPNNWSLSHVPDNTEQAVFDGGAAATNQAVTVDVMAQIDSLVFQNNYTRTMTINADITLVTVNGFDLTGNLNPNQVTNIRFNATTSRLQADGGFSFIENFNFTGQRGTVSIALGGTLIQETTTPSTSYADFLIGGVFQVTSVSATVFLRGGAGITIAASGQMIVQDSPGITVFETLNSGAILENHGIFSFLGNAGTMTTFAMPFLNHGEATFDAGAFSFSRSSTVTNGYGIMMDAGSITLKNGVDLRAQNGYLQTGGTLSTADAVAATISLEGTQNKAQLDGGIISLGGANNYGKLTFAGGADANVNFNGARFNAKINGQTSNQQDQLFSTGRINVGGNSTLVVTAVGAVAQLKTWRIMRAQSGDAITDFPNKTLPQGVTTVGAQLAQGWYQLDS